MSTTMAQSAHTTTEDYEAAFYGVMADAEGLNEQMRRDCVEIDKLKAKSQAVRDETRLILAGIGVKV